MLPFLRGILTSWAIIAGFVAFGSLWAYGFASHLLDLAMP